MTTDDAMWARGSAMPQTDEVHYSDVVLYIIDINDDLAAATGVDLVSAAGAGVDSLGAREVVRELGVQGKAYIKIVNGKSYLILKGYADLRPTLNSTRYLANNPNVSKIVVGSKNLVSSSKALSAGAIRMSGIAFVAYTVINIIEHVLRDEEFHMAALIGEIASDTTKFAIAAGLGFLAGAAVASLTTVVAGPLIASIVVGLAASFVLDRIDREFGLTDKLIELLDAAGTSIYETFMAPFEYAAEEMARWEEYYMNQAINATLRRMR